MNWKNGLIILFLFLFCLNSLALTFSITNVRYDPIPAIPGKTIDLFVTVKNDSTLPAENFEFVLNLHPDGKPSDFPFSLAGDSLTKTVSSLVGGQSTVIKYTLLIDNRAPSGAYLIQFSYGARNDVKNTALYSVSVIGRKPQLELIEVPLLQGRPGGILETALVIKNVGDSDAFGILVGVEEDRTVTTAGTVVEREILPIGLSSTFVASLKAGEQQTVTLNLGIAPNIALKTYFVPIKIRFKDFNGTEYLVTRTIGIQVNADAGLDFSLSQIKPLAFPGQTVELSFDIFNLGEGPAKFTIVSLTADTETGIFLNPKTYIGTLESDDFDSFKTKLEINSASSTGQKIITVTAAYKDQYGSEKSVSKTLFLEVYSEAQAKAKSGQSSNGILDLVLLIVGLGIIFWVYKKFIKKSK
ncbi:MAG: hypothetical protein Q7S92_01465 [Candidatus Diapherotrites archaeon]|nr:hypothetical protein [Candidatus Diapherotrites archaeon]